MSNLLSKSWFLAILALIMMLGTQAVAYLIYRDELFPEQKDVLVIKREDPSPISWNFSSEDLRNLKSELDDRAGELDEKETRLIAYEAQLKSDRKEIEAIKKDVEEMRDTLLKDVVEVEEWERKNLKILADTYGNLDPDATVSIFKELDDATVAKIMRFMKPNTIGEILQEMAMQGGGNEALIKKAAKLSNLLRLSKDENAT
jgi:flagellar motility protein MotE (MotC chaperone)